MLENNSKFKLLFDYPNLFHDILLTIIIIIDFSVASERSEKIDNIVLGGKEVIKSVHVPFSGKVCMNAEDCLLVKTLVSALSEHISLPSGSSNPLMTSMFAVHGLFCFSVGIFLH